MKKRILALALSLLMVFAFVAACGGDDNGGTDGGAAGTNSDNDLNVEGATNTGDPVINVYAFTWEVPNAIARYKELNPDFKYDFSFNVVSEENYQNTLDTALTAGGSSAPDLYTAESAYVLKYTQGEASTYPLSYEELGIDVGQLASAEIAPYISQVGTRPSDGKLVGLAFQNTGSCLIYRASIASEVFGTDDPADVQNIVGPGWDKFLEAAATLSDAGYAITSGEGDVWQAMRETATTPWIVDDKLVIDPNREAFLDVGKALYDGGYTNRSGQWSEPWNNDMGGVGEKEVFCFLGPAWLINYVMINHVGDTFGDWRVTVPPQAFSWGGTWVMANSQGNPDVREGVKELIEWITLDTSENGFQYKFATGSLYDGSKAFPDEAAAFAAGESSKDCVASGVVMAKANGEVAVLGGQNMFDFFIPASATARGDYWSPYDSQINGWFNDNATQYFEGSMSREDALESFKTKVSDELGFGS